jgi:hypothetical protein
MYCVMFIYVFRVQRYKLMTEHVLIFFQAFKCRIDNHRSYFLLQHV